MAFFLTFYYSVSILFLDEVFEGFYNGVSFLKHRKVFNKGVMYTEVMKRNLHEKKGGLIPEIDAPFSFIEFERM